MLQLAREEKVRKEALSVVDVMLLIMEFCSFKEVARFASTSKKMSLLLSMAANSYKVIRPGHWVFNQVTPAIMRVNMNDDYSNNVSFTVDAGQLKFCIDFALNVIYRGIYNDPVVHFGYYPRNPTKLVVFATIHEDQYVIMKLRLRESTVYDRHFCFTLKNADRLRLGEGNVHLQLESHKLTVVTEQKHTYFMNYRMGIPKAMCIAIRIDPVLYRRRDANAGFDILLGGLKSACNGLPESTYVRLLVLNGVAGIIPQLHHDGCFCQGNKIMPQGATRGDLDAVYVFHMKHVFSLVNNMPENTRLSFDFFGRLCVLESYHSRTTARMLFVCSPPNVCDSWDKYCGRT
jgi:hypothetical protein